MPPRALSQPWLTEAVGTAEWTGTPLAPLLADAGRGRRRARGRVHGPRPRHPGRRRARLRTQPRARRRAARRGAARIRDERRAAARTARLPAARDRPGLVRDDARQVAARDHRRLGAVHGLAAGGGVPPPSFRGRPRRAGDADAAAVALRAAGAPRLLRPEPRARSGARACSRGARGPASGRSCASR